MKTQKTQLILLCLLLAALLCACGQEPAAPERVPEETPAAMVTLIEDYEPPEDFGDEESLAMANYLCANRALFVEEYFYTLDYDETLRPVLGRYRVVDNNLREFTVLVENCVAEYLCTDGEALYYINGGRAERLPLGGGKARTLCADARTLQLHGGRLYYLDAEGRFCRMETDGGAQTVLLEGPCDYPYVLGGLLLVQKGAQNALWLRELEGEGEWRLTDGAAYAPLLIGRELFFTMETDGGKRLCSLELGGGDVRILSDTPLRGTAEFFPEDGWRTRLALEGDLLRQRILPLDAPDGAGEDCAYSGYHLLDYVGAKLRVDAVYEAGGRLNSFMLYTPDGGVIRYFGGKTIE